MNVWYTQIQSRPYVPNLPHEQLPTKRQSQTSNEILSREFKIAMPVPEIQVDDPEREL